MKKNVLIGISLLLFSCGNDDSQGGYTKIPLAFEKPSNFPEIVYDLESNPITEDGFELGRRLFYDGKLSSDGTISCGFCHEQATAFTHHGHQFSHGIDDLEGIRNTPAIQNVAFQSQFSWDGATIHLDRFPIIPITNPVEMNESVENVLHKLKADEKYQQLFSLAFDDGRINRINMQKALSQFMLMMISADSKYDKYVRGEEGGDFTEQEKKGLVTFKQKCAVCHNTDLFTDDSFRNNGLPEHPIIKDLGRFRVSDNETDKYKFKVPSLRNVAITRPYMHDGRFYSLEQVLDFYSSGVQDSPTLDPILKHTDGSLGIKLSKEEKENIIMFLNTLTDIKFINDERFAE